MGFTGDRIGWMDGLYVRYLICGKKLVLDWVSYRQVIEEV